MLQILTVATKFEISVNPYKPSVLFLLGPRCYKTFFMLNSTEHKISTAHISFCGCVPRLYLSTGRVGLCFLWFYVQELPKAQPAVVLVLKRLRRRGNGLKSHQTD